MNKIISIVLTVVIFVLSAVTAAAVDSVFPVGVIAFEGARKTLVRIQQNNDEAVYRLYLPADCAESALRVSISGKHSVFLDGAELTDNETTSLFSVGDHTVTLDGVDHPLQVFKSSSIPALFIDTASGSLERIHADKRNAETGSFTLFEGGKVLIDSAELKSVKGRGNSTWAADKKPYNIKFDKKTDVLGMGKAKKWSLLANHFDATLLRNSFAFDLAERFGLKYTPSYRMLDLYVNGEYQGNYQIIESVEIGETRVDITDLEDANEEANPGVDVEEAGRRGETGKWTSGTQKWVNIKSPTDYTGGYLLETEMPDRYLNEISGFVTPNGQAMVLKSPEYASESEVKYIAGLFADAEEAICSPDGYNSKGKHYSEYFDMDQLVRMYILTEYTFHRDAGQSSCYFYKDVGNDVLHAGPAWDFDLSLGNTKYNGRMPFSVSNPETWWANALFYTLEGGQAPTIFTRLYKHEDFRSKVAEYWPGLSDEISKELALIPSMIERLLPSAVMNALRWKLPGKNETGTKEDIFRKDCADMLSFAQKRQTALTKGFSENGAQVYYDANGGKGYLFNGQILSIGDSVTAREIDHQVTPITPPKDCKFNGWNTKRDGTGAQVNTGEKLQLTDKTTTLYAQWKNIYAPSTIAENLFDINHSKKTVLLREPLDANEAIEWFSENVYFTDAQGADVSPEANVGTGYLLHCQREDGTEAVVYTMILQNDIDGNGKINSSDARLALRRAAKLDQLNDFRNTAADADGNGKVTSGDARLILRIAAGLA